MTTTEKKDAGHRRRLRERFLKNGLAGFADYEVLELLLTLNTPRRDCKEQAKALLKRFKTFQNVLEATSAELCEINGVGEKNALGIRLIREVADRYLESRFVGKRLLKGSREVFDYLYYNMGDKDRENFKVIYLDARNRIIGTETLFEGTLAASAVYPREVVKSALENRAAALIFVHNHPSGDPTPSHGDMKLTKRLFFACATVGVSVHEHIIVGDKRYYSFADQGHIARLKLEWEEGQG